MKKSIAAGVILIAVLLGSCSGAGTDTQDSANSTAAVTQGAQTSAVSTEVDTAAVTAETDPPAAELTDMDGISEAENCTVYDTDMDLDKELEGYAVYEATKNKYFQYYNGSIDTPEMPDKFAVRFTDVDNFAIVIENLAAEDTPDYSYQYVTKIYYGAVKIEQIKGMYYGPHLDIVIATDAIFVGMFNSTFPPELDIETDSNDSGTYGFFIYDTGAKYYLTNSSETGFKIRFFADEEGEKITYTGYNPKYYLSFQSFFFVLDAFENEDDIDRITGELVIADGKINKTELARYTVAESYGPDSPTFGTRFNMYYDLYDVDTLKEIVAIYNQYKEEGSIVDFAKELNTY